MRVATMHTSWTDGPPAHAPVRGISGDVTGTSGPRVGLYPDWCPVRPGPSGRRAEPRRPAVLLDRRGGERTTSRARSRPTSRSCAVTHRLGPHSCWAGCDGRRCGATARRTASLRTHLFAVAVPGDVTPGRAEPNRPGRFFIAFGGERTTSRARSRPMSRRPRPSGPRAEPRRPAVFLTAFREGERTTSRDRSRLRSRSCAVTHRFGSHSRWAGCDGRRCGATATWRTALSAHASVAVSPRGRGHPGERNRVGRLSSSSTECGGERTTSRARSRLMSRLAEAVGSRAGPPGPAVLLTAFRGERTTIGLGPD